MLPGSNEKIKLSGFNNLTKILSFNLYDFCITFSEKQKDEYINFINEKYNASQICKIARKVCDIIEANILHESSQDYDPVGSSTMTLMSDIKGGKWEDAPTKVNAKSTFFAGHLDKSHITAHTYPDAADANGICSFRVDIDVATCGEIIPLNCIDFLFDAFECDVVYIDYVVRGYTRLASGKKIYNDHYFNSIQDFMRKDILDNFHYRSDLNIPRDNIWQTKLMYKDVGPSRYVFDPKDISHPQIDEKMKLLYENMREVYHLY